MKNDYRRDGAPCAEKVLNQSGMVTNAHQDQPNGMEFKKPEVEEYFTAMQKQHWRDEDGYAGDIAQATPDTDWVKQYEMERRVEDSRFVHRPVTGRKE